MKTDLQTPRRRIRMRDRATGGDDAFTSGRGFSLTELLVVLAILGVLMTAAVPLWNAQVERARRTDATGALMRIGVLQERFYFETGRYAGASDLTAAPPEGLGVSGSERDYYRLSLRPLGGDLTMGYQARAVADLEGVQRGDNECRVFSLDSTGRRTAENADGQDSTESCWP